jgi:hypothetical protein
MVARTVASKKAKGRRFQQYIRDKILALSKDFHAEDVKSAPMGVPGEDIQLSRFVRHSLPYQIECKSVSEKRHPLEDYMEQARSHGSHTPIVMIKRDRKKPLVVMEADHFFELMKERIDNERES